MTPADDDQQAFPDTFASPPCFMHELDPAFTGLVNDPVAAQDVARWRKAERERLIAARLALGIGEREANAKHIAQSLDQIVSTCAAPVVSTYWPFRGEPDLRSWMAILHARRICVALPVVMTKGQPLQFRAWEPSAPLARGIWGIPFPANGAIVVPNVVIAPVVGFDPAGFRLGYGGGFYDRTLAGLDPKPIAIGIGHPIASIPTIYPQPHDIPMDWIVTGSHPPRAITSRRDAP